MGLALSILLAAVIAVAWTTLWPRHVSEQAMTHVAVVVDGEEVARLVERLLSGQPDPPDQLDLSQRLGQPDPSPPNRPSRTQPGPPGQPGETPPSQAGQTSPGAWEAVLDSLREADVTGVGLHEWALAEAASRGHVSLVTKANLDAMESPLALRLPPGLPGDARSEERRVGTECGDCGCTQQ